MIPKRPLVSKTKTRSFRKLWLAALVAVAIGSGSTPAFAANFTWSGSGGDNNWSTAANWRGGVVAVSGPSNALIFAGSLRLGPIADSPFSLSGLTFASGAGAFTLTGTTLTLSNSGTITNSSSSTQSIAVSDIVLLGSSTWNAASGQMNVSSVLTGTGGITKIGTNVLTLSASNAYTGTTTLTAGTLAIGDDGALSTSVVLLNGGTLRASGGRTLGNATTLAASSGISGTTNLTLTNALTNTGAFTLAISNTGTTTLGAVNLTNSVTARVLTLNVTGGPTIITGTVADGGGVGSLVKAGTGILTLSSANTYTGTTTLTAGTLVAGNDLALGTSVLAFNGGTLQGSGARTIANTLQLTASSGLSGTSNLTLTGVLTSTNSLTLTVANTGTTTLGAVNLSNNNTARTLTLNVTGGPTFITGPVANGGTGAGSLAKGGAGLLALSGTNTYSGTTSIFNGTVRIDSSAALPTGRAVVVGGTVASGTATLDLNGNSVSIGTLQLGGAGGKANAVNLVSTGTGTLTLGGDVSTVSTGNPGTALITGKLDLGGATRNFTIANSTNASVDLEVRADISGSGGITKAGAGTLLLSSTNNTYTGPTIISAGALRLSNFNTLPSTTNLQLNGGVIDLAADLALVTGTSAGQLQWIGSGGFSASGTNRTVTLSSGADLTWGTTSFVTNTGTLVLGAAGADSTVTLSNNIDLGGAARTVATVAGSAATSGILSGTLSNGSLIVNGSGALQLGGANTYTGSTVILGGTLIVNNLANGGTASSLGASSNAAANLVLAGGVLQYTGTGSQTDRLIQLGAANGYLDSSGSGAVVFSNTGALTYGTTNQARDLTLQGSNTGDNIFAASIGNNGSGLVRVDKDGSGKWVLSGSNSYTDVTYIYGGILSIANNYALGNTSSISMLSGAALNLNNVDVGFRLFNESGTGTPDGAGVLTVTGTSTISGTIVLNTTNFTVGGVGTLNLNSYINDIFSGTLTKVGSGTLVIHNPQRPDGIEYAINQGTVVLSSTGITSISGTMATVNAGATLRIGSSNGNQINDYSSVTVNTGGLFDFNGHYESIIALYGSGTLTNTAVGTAATLNIGVSDWSVDSTFSGYLQDGAGTFALIKSGTSDGTFTLTGSNSYSGGTTLTSGTLIVGNDSALGTGLVTLNGGVLAGSGAHTLANALRLNASSEISGTSNLAFTNTLTNTNDLTLTVSNTGTTTLGAVNLSNNNTPHTLSINTTGGPMFITGSISNGGAGAGQLAKTGTGTLTLTGSNSYTGFTTVYAGKLIVNGDNSSATGNVTVAGNATLGGSGIVGGATTIQSSGTLSPGNSPGTITFNQSLTLEDGALLLIEGGDLVVVNGDLALGNNWTLTLTSGFQDGGSMTLFTYGSFNGLGLAPTFDISGLGFTPTGPLTLTDTGSAIVLNGISAIPEPGTWVLLAFGLGALLLFRRRAA